MANEPDIDPLELDDLRPPLLTELMKSMLMKAELAAVANEIKHRYLAKYNAQARFTGNLGSTAKVKSRKYPGRYGWRWEADFEVGGPKAPYVVEVEAEHHLLAQVLRDLGYFTGDMRVVGPPNPRPR